MTVNKNCHKKKRTKTLEYRVDFFYKNDKYTTGKEHKTSSYKTNFIYQIYLRQYLLHDRANFSTRTTVCNSVAFTTKRKIMFNLSYVLFNKLYRKLKRVKNIFDGVIYVIIIPPKSFSYMKLLSIKLP